MLVEKLSGALVFTRSFTDAFDLRHPRSERMNLSALLFALLNFAGTSLRLVVLWSRLCIAAVCLSINGGVH